MNNQVKAGFDLHTRPLGTSWYHLRNKAEGGKGAAQGNHH